MQFSRFYFSDITEESILQCSHIAIRTRQISVLMHRMESEMNIQMTLTCVMLPGCKMVASELPNPIKTYPSSQFHYRISMMYTQAQIQPQQLPVAVSCRTEVFVSLLTASLRAKPVFVHKQGSIQSRVSMVNKAKESRFYDKAHISMVQFLCFRLSPTRVC